MTVHGSSDMGRATPWGLGTSCLVLTLALAVVVVPLGFWRSQGHADGWFAAVLAGAIVWVGSNLALVLATMARGTTWFIHAQLGGMLFRLGLPLGAVVILHAQGGSLVEAGAPQCVLILYLVSLVVETLLVLPLARQGVGRTAERAPAGRAAADGSAVSGVGVARPEAGAAKEPENHG